MDEEDSLPVHNGPPLYPVLSQMNSGHFDTTYSLKIHWWVPSLLCLDFLNGFLLSGVPKKKCVTHVSRLSHACRMPRLTHPSSFDRPNNIWWRVGQQIINLIMHCSTATRCRLLLAFQAEIFFSACCPQTPPTNGRWGKAIPVTGREGP
jgi:hypothetical protein